MNKINITDLKIGYDIVIVGAGPAGCVFAKTISKNFSVLMVDSRTIPRDKPCGGMLVSASKEFLKSFSISEEFTVKPKYLSVTYLDWEKNTKKHEEKNFLNVDRKKFDYWLFSNIKKPNISFLQSAKLIEFTYTKNNLISIILESNGTIKSVIAKYVIGCDGAISTVRQKLSKKNIPYYLAMQETIQSKKMPKNALFIYDNSITDFYSWVIPKNNELLIGSALFPSEAKNKFNILKNKLKEKYGIYGKGSLKSAIILRPRSINDICLGKKNVFLAGEAAGLITPTSGEGISFAMRSGQFAAEAINNSEEDPLSDYREKCKELTKVLERKFKKLKNFGIMNWLKAFFNH
ncbi:MAG: geranylgeranyl reductase family protein [Candidatus Diapherotrites archaeon]